MLKLEKLNTGLSRIVSVKTYPTTRRRRLPRDTRGRVFRLGVLHSKEMTEAMLLRNRRGFVNSQMNTVAHAPSLYHWLFHRCGVPFAEARALVETGGLSANGNVIDHDGLERQCNWADMQKMDIRLRVEVDAAAGQTSGSAAENINDNSNNNGGSSGGGSSSVMWVPALKRALHRQYFLLYLHPGISITSDQTDPRSFVHRLTPLIGETAGMGMNILRPIGFMNGMKGLGLATNDVSMVRYWNNEFLGNYGVYDIRFARGVPSEVIHQLAAEVNNDLDAGIRKQLSKDVKVPCTCTVESVPDLQKPNKKQQQSHRRDLVSELYRIPLHSERLLMCTSLLPYRVARKLRRAGGVITLVRSGPFALPLSLPTTKLRPLSPQELALMFSFERKLKTNRLILSLREFDADEGGMPEVTLPSV